PTLRERFPDGSDRRRAIDTALRQGGALDPLDSGSHERVADWTKGETDEGQGATIVVDLISEDPEDLTLRQARMLGEADAVCSQGDVSPAILARARADAARIVCEDTQCLLRSLTPGDHGASNAPCPKAARMLQGTNLTVVLRTRL
ncbi:MAG: siroheme synthase, partial [Erythrobacter sp.]|nr:siroheme synthase [Erythrobacter sp.]